MCVRVSVCVSVCVRVCVFVCVRVRACACVCEGFATRIDRKIDQNAAEYEGFDSPKARLCSYAALQET